MEPTPDNASETTSATTSIKRKADEAFDALDDALRPRFDRPFPSKRVNSTIYSSLEKYGIKSNSSSPSKTTTSTPTLTALLSRARSKKSKETPLPIPQYKKTSSVIPEYSPGSTDAFLQRLSTFSFSSYPSKPPQIDAVAASKAGWINEGGKDRLYCAICRVGWVVAGREGLSRDAADALIEKQRTSLVDMHKEGCPWRIRQCDPLVYRIPLKSPTNMARQIKARAAELEPVLDGVAIRHPLSSNQVQTFVQTVSSVPNQNSALLSSATEDTAHPPAPLLSPASLLTSLFGWSLVPPLPLLSRKSSSASLTLARTHSRASSIQIHTNASREGTPTSGGSAMPASQSSPPKSPTTPFGTPLNGKAKATDSSAAPASPSAPSFREPPQQKDAMLQCQMCQRRIGLWAFAAPTSSANVSATSSQPTSSSKNANNRPQRQLDLLREHRSYCPYVVKSTPLTSLPSYPAPRPQSSAPSSFNLTRTGTSSSAGEAQNPISASASAFNLRRTASLISSASSSLTRTNPSSFAVHLSSSEGLESNLVEGWRAVYNTVLRFGMSERSRVRVSAQASASASNGSAPESETEPVGELGEKDAEDEAMSGVIELVEGVKQHGGKQLLAYVRSLLG